MRHLNILYYHHFTTKDISLYTSAGLNNFRGRIAWWRHQMETFSALLAFCAGNSPVRGEFSTQRPVTRSVDAFFDLHLNKQLSKQSQGWWFETPSCSLWRQCNGPELHNWYNVMIHIWIKTFFVGVLNLFLDFHNHIWLHIEVNELYMKMI